MANFTLLEALREKRMGVCVYSESELNALLSDCEELGLKWADGRRPTQFIPHIVPLYVEFNDYDRLVWGSLVWSSDTKLDYREITDRSGGLFFRY